MVVEAFELYLIRHGVAAEQGENYPEDAKRPLTWVVSGDGLVNGYTSRV